MSNDALTFSFGMVLAFLNCTWSLIFAGFVSLGVPNGVDRQRNWESSIIWSEDWVSSEVRVPNISDIPVRSEIATGTPVLHNEQ